MNPSLLPLAGAGVRRGGSGLTGERAIPCLRYIAQGTRVVRHLARLAHSLATVDAASDRPPAVGRRCLRSDLDQREIVRALAARKAHLVGAARPHAAQAGVIPVKRGRRFALVQG